MILDDRQGLPVPVSDAVLRGKSLQRDPLRMLVARGVLAAAVQPPSTKGRRDVAKQPYGEALRNVSSAGCLPPLFASLAIAIKKLIKKN